MAEHPRSSQVGLVAAATCPDPVALLKEIEEGIERQVAAARERNRGNLDHGFNEEEAGAVGVALGRVNESGVPERIVELRANRVQTSR